jgi:hypothetical protein
MITKKLDREIKGMIMIIERFLTVQELLRLSDRAKVSRNDFMNHFRR